jgi:uracil-xanthine permease
MEQSPAHVAAAQDTTPTRPPGIIYDLEERPPLPRLVLFAAQHLMVGFAVMIGVPLAFSVIVGLEGRAQTVLISGVLVAGGVVTILQAIGLGPIGARLPLVNSTTFKFLGPLVLAYKAGGFGAVYGASILSGFITAGLGVFVGRIQRIFTPFVVGAFLVITGTALMPIALSNLLAVGKPYEGTATALLAGAVPLLVMIGLSVTRIQRLRPLRPIAVLLGFSIGYAVSAALGLIDWSPVGDAAWFGLAVPYSLGAPSWPGLVLAITVTGVFIACLVETAGDSTAVSAILGRRITPKQLRGAVIADGLSGPISSVFGGLPMTTYGQNVGLVRLSGVGSRYVVAGTGILLILVGALPKFAALISAMPSPVLGAGLAMTFGMIAAEGIRRAGPYLASPRNAAVLTLGLLPAIGLRTLPQEFLAKIPSEIAPLLTDPLVTGLLVTIIAHLILPGRTGEPDGAEAAEPAH